MYNCNISLRELLLHWWHYYGALMYTLQELEDFEKLMEQYGEEKILEVALASYIKGDGKNTILLLSMRQNKVEQLLHSLPCIESFDHSTKLKFSKIKEDFLSELQTTYLKKNANS